MRWVFFSYAPAIDRTATFDATVGAFRKYSDTNALDRAVNASSSESHFASSESFGLWNTPRRFAEGLTAPLSDG
jgi:hypothetical protein